MDISDQKINLLPINPGVYLFKDKKGTILYVGKAGNIKHRVSSYFQRQIGKDVKTLAMLEARSRIYSRKYKGGAVELEIDAPASVVRRVREWVVG